MRVLSEVLSERAVRKVVHRAASKADNAHRFSKAARARLAVLKASAEEAAARAEKLIGPDPFRKAV